MTLLESSPRTKDAHLWARHPQDWYVEPIWTSERLFAVEPFDGGVLDPACGSGRIVEAAKRVGHYALGSDLEDRANGAYWHSIDFISNDFPREVCASEDAGGLIANIVSNPPFGIADAFAAHSLSLARKKVALLLPTKWMNGAKRGAWLETTPLRRVWLLGPRPSMPPGPAIEAGIAPGNGTTDFAWFVWEQGYRERPVLSWLRRDG